MVDYTKNHQQTQPLASSANYPKSDHVILHVASHHRPPPPKRTDKCFVYFFAFFILLCLLLLIFSIIVLRPKPLPLCLSSPGLRSLSYDQTPTAFAAIISIQKPNFGPLHLRSASILFLHGNSTVGSGSAALGSRKKVIRCQSKEVVKLSATSEKSMTSIPWEDQENNRLMDELNSGVLMLKGFVKAAGEVVLFRRITRKTYGKLECDISIDLRSHKLLRFEVSCVCCSWFPSYFF